MVAACAAMISSAAHAGLNYNTVPAPGGFVQACAGPSTGGASPWPGSDVTAYFTAPGSVVHEQSFSGDASAHRTAAYAAGSTANACDAQSGLGWAILSATNDAPNSSSFAGSEANGGWTETFRIDSPGLTGMTGYMQFTLNVTGSLHAAGFAGSASFLVTGYKDNAQLMINGLFNKGGSDALSTDRQYGNWAVSSSPDSGKTVTDTVTFAVTFTYGTPFKLGIYGLAKASMRSSSGVSGNSTADANFQLTWGGVSWVYFGLFPNSNYTITSGTGVDWSGPQDPPIPGDLNGDGQVDSADLGLLLLYYGPCDDGCGGADLNGDGQVDSADLGLLLLYFS
jgi:hypothetical protein